MIDLRHGDCLDVMRTLPEASVDAVVTDPPYGLSFMGKGWDHGVPGVEFWAEAMRVAKPGAHLLAFGGTRTYHRLACAIEDAGWEIRDCVMWVYGSGFPKSLDVSKAIDKAAGAEREKVPATGGLHKNRNMNDDGWSKIGEADPTMDSPTPATDAARQWAGWGTALKPAWEPVIVSRKPLEGTVAENVLRHGTGGINVDGCRVGTDDKLQSLVGSFSFSGSGGANEKGKTIVMRDAGLGRWPANLIHDGSDEVVGLFPQSISTGGTEPISHNDIYGKYGPKPFFNYADSGSAARFFYCAKASKADRDEGLAGTCTVKYDVPKGASSCKDVSMVLVALLRRAICESTVRWHIAESGESIMGRCPLDSLSTIATAISRTTESKILNWLTPSLISESIADANCVAANGGSRVASAERSSESQATITPERLEALARGAKDAVSPMLSAISDAGNWKPASNIHSTVKPTALMRYLCRLVTPPNGIVLDPFCGSGSTGKAAVLEGFRFIGIEREMEYITIAEARIRAAVPELFR